jgi:putative acetyltransferase
VAKPTARNELSPHDMFIRPETTGDAPAIHRVLCEAFPSELEAGLVAALRRNNHLRVSFVAELDGEVVGHVAFSPVQLEPAHNSLHLLGLAPLAVLTSHRRQGVAAALVEQALDACRNLNVDAVVVLGEPAYYRRFGFRRAADFGISNEYGVNDEFMTLELRMSCLSGVRALARYGQEFTDL